MEWILGTWEQKDKSEVIFYELWEKVNDTVIVGKCYALNDEDTIISKTIQLIQRQDSLFYIPFIIRGNSHFPMSFFLVSASENKLLFENFNHDFPQKILYEKMGSELSVIEFSDTINDSWFTHSYSMKKLPK